jgi:hypothetical protein
VAAPRDLRQGVIVGAHATVGAGCVLGRGCVVGEGAVIGPGAKLLSGCYVQPNEIVPSGFTLPHGFVFSKRAIEFADTIPTVISGSPGVFCARKSGFASLQTVIDVADGNRKLVTEYFELLIDYPAEAGRQMAACKGQVIGLIPDLLSIFNQRTLLVVLGYWNAEARDVDNECDRAVRELCEAAIPEFDFTLKDFENENFLPSLVEICESVSLMRDKGIHEVSINILKGQIVAKSRAMCVTLMLMGCPADALVLSLLQNISRLCGVSMNEGP